MSIVLQDLLSIFIDVAGNTIHVLSPFTMYIVTLRVLLTLFLAFKGFFLVAALISVPSVTIMAAITLIREAKALGGAWWHEAKVLPHMVFTTLTAREFVDPRIARVVDKAVVKEVDLDDDADSLDGN